MGERRTMYKARRNLIRSGTTCSRRGRGKRSLVGSDYLASRYQLLLAALSALLCSRSSLSFAFTPKSFSRRRDGGCLRVEQRQFSTERRSFTKAFRTRSRIVSHFHIHEADTDCGSIQHTSTTNLDSSFLLYLDPLDKAIPVFQNLTDASASATNDQPDLTSISADTLITETEKVREKKIHSSSRSEPATKSPLFSPTVPSVEADPKPKHIRDQDNCQFRRGAPDDSMDRFAHDVTTVLKDIRKQGYDPSLPKLFRYIKMPSFTNLWTKRDWDLHTSRFRHLKYLWSIPTSRLVRRIAPQMVALAIWACAACWMCSKEFDGILSRAVLPLAPLSLVSTFVAGLLTLRSNQGLTRLNEGRLAFGKVVLYTREMAQMIATVVYPRNPALGLLAARHVALFGWLMKDFLRHYDEDYTRPLQPYQPNKCHEADVVTTMLPPRTRADYNNSHNPIITTCSMDARFILQQRKKPVAICTRLRQIFGSMQHVLTTSEQSRLDACAQQLNKCIMVCERIRASPIPPLYTAHAGRLLMFYLFFLPLALRGSSLLNNVGTILTTMVVGYAMLGLDEISHVLEEPFRLMPLYHLSKNSMKDVADSMVCMPPPLLLEDDESDDYGIGGDGASLGADGLDYERIPAYW